MTGKVVYADELSLAIDCSGVAFRLYASANTLKKCGTPGESHTLFTFLSVKEDALDLYGFYDKTELECFKMLTGVTGVGPKAALAILSVLTPEMLALAISSEDSRAITAANGVGAKIANRIILELKGKMDRLEFTSSSLANVAAVKKSTVSSQGEDAVNALVMLGYSKSEASVAVGRLEGDLTAEEMIKQALKSLAKGL